MTYILIFKRARRKKGIERFVVRAKSVSEAEKLVRENWSFAGIDLSNQLGKLIDAQEVTSFAPV